MNLLSCAHEHLRVFRRRTLRVFTYELKGFHLCIGIQSWRIAAELGVELQTAKSLPVAEFDAIVAPHSFVEGEKGEREHKNGRVDMSTNLRIEDRLKWQSWLCVDGIVAEACKIQWCPNQLVGDTCELPNQHCVLQYRNKTIQKQSAPAPAAAARPHNETPQ